jgi:hypothetical protein
MVSRKHYYFENNDKYFATCVVGILVSLPWWWFCVFAQWGRFESDYSANMQQHERDVQDYQQEMSQLSVVQRWFARSKPTAPVHEGLEVVAGTIALQLFLVFPISYWLLAERALIGVEKAKAYFEEQKVRGQQRGLQRMQKRMERDSQHQLESQQVSNGAQEVVQMLGSINQFVIVYQNEVSSDRKVMCLQQISFVATNLMSKKASGEIPAASFRSVQVVQCGRETMTDLRTAGLGAHSIYRILESVLN